jgi:hypothetical protein
MHLYVLFALLLGALAPPTLVAAVEEAPLTPRKHVPRVRAADARVAAAITEGRKRSESFRAIHDRVEALNVIVYVETQPQLRGRLAGCMTWVTATQEFRYVRVSISPDLPATLLISSIAHELQHVLEVGEELSIVDTDSLTKYYKGASIVRHTRTDEWDTIAAQRMGETVRRELAVSAILTNGRVAESIQSGLFEEPR